MKKIFLFLLAIPFLQLSVLCQEEKTFASHNQSLFLELGGNGLAFSANFDSRFKKSDKGLGYRIGIGLVPGVDAIVIETSTWLTLPFGINYLAGKAPNYFEAGLGGTFVSGNAGDSFDEIFGESGREKFSTVAFVPSAGYRHAREGKGFTWRVFISPLIAGGGAFFWGGVSLGVKLN